MQKPERSVYTPQDFQQWQAASALDLTPKFQRRGVWTPATRSHFIDTLLKQMPVPPIYIRVIQSDDRTRRVHQIIDGQQRISCVLDFINGKFRISKSIAETWAGKTFDALTPDEKARVTTYSFSAELFHAISDDEVLEMFARLNTYSVQLNAQELRNGRYFGQFKQTAYGLAYAHLGFWRRHEIFTERSIARMLEVELTSELLIAQIDGMQDKKKSINNFYEMFDEKFDDRSLHDRRFRAVIDVVSESFSNTLSDTEFSRAPLFYSLYCAIYHRQYGLRGVQLGTPKRQLTQAERLSLTEAVHRLSEPIAAGRAGDAVPSRYQAFVAACLRQTDNRIPRQERLRTLYQRAFSER